MKLIETICKRKEYSNEDPEDYRVRVKLIPDPKLSTNKEIEVSFGHGEPEDMYLHRDLNDAYSIIDLVQLAHAAGACGEELYIDRIEEISED